MALGKRVFKRRKDLGLTQAELGRRADLTKQAVSQIEKDRFVPSIDALQRLASALRCTAGDLLDQKTSTRATA